jgi:hypothetical protein
MSEKRPIDIKRNSAISQEIGTIDEGPVESMVVIDDSLFFIKRNAIYAVQTADQIDHARTNIALPKAITRQVFAVGSESEIVGKILLTGISLLAKGHHVREGVDTQRALSVALDALTTVLTTRAMAFEFEAVQTKACEKAAAHPEQQPFLGDAKARCKAFAQQADHAVGALLDIVHLFYPEINNAPWEALRDKMRLELGDEDAFLKFLDGATPFFKLIRNTRNCLDHRNLKGVTVKDFEVQSDGTVHPPTIEIDFRGSQHPMIAVYAFMDGVIVSLTNCFEMMLAHLCNINTRQPAPMFPIYIDTLPEGRRRWKHVRFYYGSSISGEFVRIG